MEKDSRAKLIEAATQLFAEKGFAEVSIRELAKTAEVNSALIAYYFGGKEGLYQAVVEEYFKRIEERMAKISMSPLDPLDKLKGFVSNLAALHQEMPYLRKFLSRELLSPTPMITHVIKKYVSHFYSMALGFLNEGLLLGEIRPDVIPQFVPIAVAGMIHFYFMAEPVIKQMATIVPDLDNKKMFIDQIEKLWLNGLLRKEESSQSSNNI